MDREPETVTAGPALGAGLVTISPPEPPPAGRRGSAAGRPAGAGAWLVAVASLVSAVTAMFSRWLFADGYYDLYAGRYIAAHGIPHRNALTLASHGAPWIDQQWLAHLAYYGAWAAGGYPAVGVLSAALAAAGFTVLALLILRRGAPPARMFAWTVAAFAAFAGNAMAFAQSFAYPLFAVVLWLILADDGAPRLRARTWLAVPVLVLWANLHGSVLLGAALVVLYAGYRVAGALVRRQPGPAAAYLGLAAASAGAVLCTPYGTGVIRYYGSLIGNPVLARYVSLWAPPQLGDPLSWAFFALVLAVAAAVAVAWRRGTRPGLLLAGITLAMVALALTAARNEVWFAFAGSLLAAGTLARSSRDPASAPGVRFGRAVAGVLAASALACLAALAVTPTTQFESLVSPRAVSTAVALAARDPSVRVLGDVYSGPAMLWLHPAMAGRVGFDSRFEQYTRPELSAFLDFLAVRGPGWQRVMRGYGIVVASRRADGRLARALARLPGWRIVYQDSAGLVLERRPASRAGAAGRPR